MKQIIRKKARIAAVNFGLFDIGCPLLWGISTILLRISVEYAGYLVPWRPSYEEFVYGTGGLTKMKCDGMLKLWNFTENRFSR